MSAVPAHFADWFQPAPSIVPIDAPPDALGWADLPGDQPTVGATGRSPVQDGRSPLPADPGHVATLAAECAIVHGDIDLDVLADPAGEWIEIGPFRLKTPEAQRLLQLLREHLALVGAYRWIARKDAKAGDASDRPVARTMPRNPTGRAQCPPWEGETLP